MGIVYLISSIQYSKLLSEKDCNRANLLVVKFNNILVVSKLICLCSCNTIEHMGNSLKIQSASNNEYVTKFLEQQV